MMMKSFLAAAALAALPLSASAITLMPGVDGFTESVLYPSVTDVYDFDVSEPLNVTFSFSATGDKGQLEKLTFGASYSSPEKFTTFGSGLTFGGGVIDFAYVDDAFSVYLSSNGTTKPLPYTLSWVTTPAPVPLPAAGALLGMALLGIGGVAAKRRRKNEDA